MPVDKTGLAALQDRFHARHEAVHGHAARGADIEAVSYRLRAVVPVRKLDIRPHAAAGPVPGGKAAGRRAMADAQGDRVAAAIWRRNDLPDGAALAGPLIVEQPDSTTVVPPGWTVRRDACGNLELMREGAP